MQASSKTPNSWIVRPCPRPSPGNSGHRLSESGGPPTKERRKICGDHLCASVGRNHRPVRPRHRTDHTYHHFRRLGELGRVPASEMSRITASCALAPRAPLAPARPEASVAQGSPLKPLHYVQGRLCGSSTALILSVGGPSNASPKPKGSRVEKPQGYNSPRPERGADLHLKTLL